ncbi:oligoribonuclease, mitochondrial isoform X2 [Arctopsyche grandis]|uniref:oligoribonuclease, mitochondrial isoform X2 n=2 Tax=Arctopsyche grandis TaxID=121162 RepID=UPI00406D655C
MSGSLLNKDNIVWMDLEMTGLDINKDTIMEIGCAITDSELNVLAKGPNIIIHHDEKSLNSMDEWCVMHHGMSGLTEACKNSKINLNTAETEILAFIKNYAPEKKCPLAGNSVYMDRLFLRKYMPRVDNHLHYRIIDVSTVKEICRRWNVNVYKNMPSKNFAHRANADIEESIRELKHYKENMFKLNE